MKRNAAITAARVIFFLLGLYLAKAGEQPEGFMTALPFVCIGIGCGMFGYGMSRILSNRMLQKNPDMKRRAEICEKDERNITIANCAKARTYDRMIFVWGALLIVFVLLGVKPVPVLLFAAVYLSMQGYAAWCRCRYEKEM